MKNKDMETTIIPVEVPTDIMIALNQSKAELRNHFQVSIAMMLFQEGKLTIGKAIQLSGLSRFEFENQLKRKNIPISNLTIEQIMSDVKKLSDI